MASVQKYYFSVKDVLFIAIYSFAAIIFCVADARTEYTVLCIF